MKLGRLTVVLWAAVAVVAAVLPAAAAANKSSSPPIIDLQARCKRTQDAVVDMMGDPSLRATAFDTCMRSEQEARAAMLKAWPDIPQAYKSFCIRQRDYSPSYVEWIACLELMIDLRRQRASTSGQIDYVSRRCPMIKYGPDGSIKDIKACPL
jgi:hypothetical protein